MSSLVRCLLRACFCFGRSSSSAEREERQRINDVLAVPETRSVARNSSSRRRGRGEHQYQLAPTNSHDEEDPEQAATAGGGAGEGNPEGEDSNLGSGGSRREDDPVSLSINEPRTASNRRRRDESGEEEKQEEPLLTEDSTGRPDTPAAASSSVSTPSRLGDFWHRVRTRLHQFEDRTIVKPPMTRTTTQDETDDDNSESDRIIATAPLLKEATSFQLGHKDGNDAGSALIPTIASDQVVVPGSDLQRAMAEKASQSMSENIDQIDECVICMEGFDETNPRMPTLCGCGENKTYFHLPCLYQWIEQSRNCPSCRQRLRWEEF